MASETELVSRKSNAKEKEAGFPGVTLEFKNLTQLERKVILDDVSGKAEPGDLVALMGASGAGKSTLLNVLSRRIASNDGEVLVNGTLADKSPLMRTSSCFIQQEDIFYGYITVQEHLTQQAKFRIPLSKEVRLGRLNDVMDTFSLNKSRNSRIGNIEQGASRGISGGEKKRLSVATELLINPSLIFADEPTSGLDAFMAESVCEVLKKVADGGHTVISTIHQPSSDVFSMFNKLLLLSEGRIVYFGPRLAAIPYFLRLGHPCPPYTNPADFLIELCAIDWENPTKKLEDLNALSIDRFMEWCEHWKQNRVAFLHEWDTELKEKFTSTIGGGTVHDIVGTQLAPAPSSTGKESFRLLLDKRGNPVRVKTGTTISTLLQRSILATSRNPNVVRARLIQTIITALLGGLVYFRLDDTAAYSKAGACFFVMVNQGFMSVYTCLTAFMGEKKIVIRERDAGLYHLATYYMAKIASDLMFQFYLPVIYTCICWYMMGLNDEFTRFLLGMLFTFLMAVGVSSIGYIIASFAPSLGVAVALGPIVILPCLLVAGFVIQADSLPDFWKWLYYLSPFVYAFSGLMRATFLDVEFSNVPAPIPGESAIYFKSGNDVLKDFSIHLGTERWFVDIGALLGWIVVGRLLGLLLFLWSNKKKTK